MKRLDSLKKIMEIYAKDKILTEKDSKLLMQMQATLKEHVLQGICTYCGGKVFLKKFKTRGEKHDYHQNGMCKPCLILMEKEPLLESDKWKN